MLKRLLRALFTLVCILSLTSATASAGFRFDYADSFYGDRAAVKIDGKYGMVDKTGKLVIPAIYEFVGTFIASDLAKIEKYGKYGMVDKYGKEVIPPIYDNIPDGFWKDAKVALVRKDGKYGVIDKTGKQIIPLIYDSTSWPSEGMIRVGQGGNSIGYGGKHGYIDATTGKEVVPLVYDNTNRFKEGLARVEKDKKYGAVDKSGRIVVPIVYENMAEFRDGLAQVRSRIGVGYVDKTGTEVVPALYDSADYKDGVIWVRKDDKYGLYDRTGKLLKSLMSTGYKYTKRLSDDVYVVSETESGQLFDIPKLGVIDRNGRIVLPMKFVVIDDIGEGMIMVAEHGKKGLIDKTGRWIVPPIYSEMGRFHEGYAFVKLDYLYGVIDKFGRQVLPLRYGAISNDRLSSYDIFRWSTEGLVPVSDENNLRWGFANKFGVEVVPCSYDEVRDFSEGIAAVKKDGKWGYIWPNGSVVNWSLE